MATLYITEDYGDEDFFSEVRPPINKKDQIGHPKNCSHECQYGFNREFCFPCMAKILAEHRASRAQTVKKA